MRGVKIYSDEYLGGERELPIQADYAGKFVETRSSETVNVLLTEQDVEPGCHRTGTNDGYQKT